MRRAKQIRGVCHRSTVVLAVALVPVAAQAQMSVPRAGAKYAFDCTSAGGASHQELYTVVGNADDVIRVEIEIGRQKNWYEKPYYLSGTTLALRERIGERESSMNVTDSFKGLAELKIGDKFAAYVTESRPDERPDWNYSVTVVGREVRYNRELGDLNVVALNEERWVNLYQSTLLSHYAPRLAFPVYWLYRDVNGAKEECTLTGAEGYGPAQVAAAPAPPPAPAPAPITAPKPMVAPPPAKAVAAAPPAPAPTPKPMVAPARPPAAPPPTMTAPKAPEASPPKPAAPAGEVPLSTAQRLAYLTELRNLGLITQEELLAKQAEIAAERSESPIAEELKQANTLFRLSKITPEQFVARRAEILAKIGPETTPGKEGLTLLSQLLEKKLISRIEFNRKRQEILAAL